MFHSKQMEKFDLPRMTTSPASENAGLPECA